jgi:putative spermidine/putrescine transport system substrate-binding protein
MMEDRLREKLRYTRRSALSTAGKIAITTVLAGVIAGIGGYYAGSSTAAPSVKTETIEKTKTITVTETVEKTPTVPPKPDKLIVRAWGGGWQYALDEAVSKTFTKKTGIKIEYDNTEDSELQAKLVELIPAGKTPPVDVNWTISTNAYLESTWGLTADMLPDEIPNIEDMLPQAKPPSIRGYKGYPFVNVYSYTYVLGYLTKYFPEPPDSWWVLWEPQYKKSVAMYDDGIGFHAVLAKLAGLKIPEELSPEKMEPAWDLLKRLLPNIGGLGEDTDLSMWLIREEMKLEVTIITNILEAVRNGAKAAWAVPKEGVEMHTDALEVPRNLPPEREYWAKQYINTALDPEVQGKWAELQGTPPLHPKAPIPKYMEGDPAFPVKKEYIEKMIIIPLDILVKYQKDWFAKFEEITAGIA